MCEVACMPRLPSGRHVCESADGGLSERFSKPFVKQNEFKPSLVTKDVDGEEGLIPV